MNFVELKYANYLSGRLPKFKIKKSNPYLANFRCPLCGDSGRSKTKARAYFYENKGTLVMKCHNCGTSATFQSFLKGFDEELYQEFLREIYIEKYSVPMTESAIETSKFTKPKFLNSPLMDLKKISQLSYNHPAKLYVLSRKIENPWHTKLFFCPKFSEWTNSIIPDKLPIENDEPRLIIPFFNRDGSLIGYQGRSFKKNTNLRYITIMLDESAPKIFGLDTVKTDQRVYVLEGPIDSMFLPNAIAMIGADIRLGEEFTDTVRIYDNEPRNVQIIKRLDNDISKGYNVVIWDNTFNGKDVNEMVLNGADQEHIKIVIDKRTFSGLEARLELMKWKRC